MEKKREGQERREEKERKGIESLNGSGERKEALETTAAVVGEEGGGGCREKNGIYSRARPTR